MKTRYDYAFGYKSRDMAEAALQELIEGDEVSEAENPAIERYSAIVRAPTSSGKTAVSRYKITLEG